MCALALVCSATLQPALAQIALPALGDTDSADFTVGAEKKLGDEIMREIRVDPDYIDDPLLLEYLHTVWDPLVAASRKLGNITPDLDQRFAWQPFLVRDPEVNAFALPGGFVGVNLGLIAITGTRDELASVLGHEMSHVTQRHIARQISGNSRRSLVSLAALLLGLLAASRSSSPDAMSAVITGTQAAALQGQLNFSRDVEREADRVGFQVMTTAGFQPSGMATMFERMDHSMRLNDFGGFPYLRTHPLTSERIGEARARAGIETGAPHVSPLEHTIAEARARVLEDQRVDALRRWQSQDAEMVGSTIDQLLAVSASAQASSLLRDWSRADAAFARSMALVRGSPAGGDRAVRALVILQAQSLLERGHARRAEALLQPYAQDGSRPTMLLSAQIALSEANTDPDTGPLRTQIDALQTWVALHPDDSLAWTELGLSWYRLGVPLRSLRAEAESRFALGDLDGAADRLRAGQRLVRSGGATDFIDASVIDSRLQVVEAQRRQIEADLRTSR